MKKDVVTVIMPVYNAKKYIAESMESLLKQSHEGLEILLVDDGSTDGSGGICDEYAKRDERIRVLHIENGGAARARNKGMDAAEGEFVFFMDSDDVLKHTAIETLLFRLKENDADCVVGKSVRLFEHKDGREKEDNSEAHKYAVAGSSEAIKRVLLYGSAMWNRLFKTKVLKDIRCPEGRINEDEPFMVRAYDNCGRIIFTEDETYLYRIHTDSVTTADFSLKQLDMVRNSRENLEFVRERYPELNECAEYKYMKSLLYCRYRLSKKKNRTKEETLAIKELSDDIRKKGFRRRMLRNRYLAIMHKALMFI